MNPVFLQVLSGQDYLLDDAYALKGHVSVPVVGVGGIEDGLFIDKVLSDLVVDFTAVGRAILKNARLWGEVHLNKVFPTHH